jgi:hypothetical protein
LARNDHQRLNENLLRIALGRSTSVNSLTGRETVRKRAVAVAVRERERESG